MPLEEAFLHQAETALGQQSPTLPALFRESVAALPAGIDDALLHLWVDAGVELAAHALRSWEPAGEYFRAGPSLLPVLDEATLNQWVESGRMLSELASPMASAFFAASPSVVRRLPAGQLREWASLGQKLFKATWKSISLASELFDLSPELLARVSIAEMRRLTQVLHGISERSADLAAACLDATPDVVRKLDQAERVAFFEFASAISDSAWPEASLYFQRGPDLLRNIHPDERAHYLEFATRVARLLGRQAFNLFSDGASSLKAVRDIYHGKVIELADGLVPFSPVAAMSLIKSAPTLSSRLRIEEMGVWYESGLEILQITTEGGEAYFRLESGKAEQMIDELTARVDLTHVAELLRLYGKALTGTNISIHPLSSLEDKGIGWVHEGGATTEGTSIYLPDFIEQYESKPENFSIFKVYATHQTAHLEFGSFDFDFRRPGPLLPYLRSQVEEQRREEGVVSKDTWLTDMERFFDLFADRKLASDLFCIVEDVRIDARIREEYSGIRRATAQVQSNELQGRPEPQSLPLRQAYVECLVRASLGGAMGIVWPKALDALLLKGLGTLDTMAKLGGTVEDTAEATLILYDIAQRIPNLPPEMLENLDWEGLTEEMLQQLQQAMDDFQDAIDSLPDGEQQPYESPDQVDFRGDFKPELVQLLMRMRHQQNEAEEESDHAPLTPEQIKELLEKSVEIDMTDEFDMSEFNMLLENLEREASGQAETLDDDDDMTGPEEPPPEAAPAMRTFYYDEWDFRASDYKPRWCAVRERRIDEGTDDYYARILSEHAGLVNETQRQFEMLKPDTFRKLKRLEDGEDVDLDAAIEFVVQKKAGHGETQKIYWRRNKVERDVAVAFLIDMSASTDEEIEKHRPRRDEASSDTTDPRRYYQWLSQAKAGPFEPPKRIIDLEKESLVLLTRALGVLGDRYGVFGFSGYGRDNVEFYVIKDLDEPFDDSIRRRIDRMSPIRSTRMGPAIRHTTAKLMEVDARARILFLVSDGRPQDHGYGRDRTEKEYAIHDTHKALQEAKHKGITPFALTVDKEGHDYLGQMCGDMAYEVLGDIELLPSRLPALYRMLTD